MWKSIRKWWSYLGAKLGMQLEATADPKVQLEQAISDAREQHRLLTEQAANVIANQKQLEIRLDRAIDDYQKANGIIALESEIESLKQAVLSANEASAKARQAVNQNSAALQKRLAEREALLTQLDQAKMQEQMNAAMSQLTAVAGDDGPTLEDVRAKIERRLATAQATSELTGVTVDSSMLVVEEAQQRAEAQARLGGIRAQLGLPAPADTATPDIKVSRIEQPAIGPGDAT